MKNLLIVSTLPVTIEAFLLPFAEYFKKKGWRVDGVASGITRSNKCCDTFTQCFDVQWTRNPFSLKNAINSINLIQKICIENDYDIVHVHTPIASFLTRFALRKIRKEIKCNVVYTAHGFHFHKQGNTVKNFIFRSIEKWATQWTDVLITINDEDFQAAHAFDKNTLKICALFPGIGINTFFYDRNNISEQNIKKIREEMKLEARDHLFTMIAEFNPGKRHLDILKALLLLNRPNVHVCFAGLGKTQSQIKKVTQEWDLNKKVHFLDFVDDVRPIILASTALVLPSEREGLPRCIMESLALNVPVLGSNIRGIKDLLSPFPDALFPVKDIKSLARKMEEMVDGKCSSNAIFLDSKYSIENIINLTESIYNDILKEKGAERQT